MALRDLGVIAANLTEYLIQSWGGTVVVSNVTETSVGARRGNILFDALLGGQLRELVVTIYPPAGAVIFGVEAETGALRLAEAAGAPVAHVELVCEDTSWFGEPFFVSTRVRGVSLPRAVLRLLDADPALGGRVGCQIGQAFAAIHAVAATDTPEAIRRAPLDVAPTRAALDVLGSQLAELWQPAPVFALGLRWLERHQPDPPATQTMVHGDTRTGNILVDTDGLQAILDWEGCHTGDPHEDLAWLCVRTWRFGNDHLEVGGLSERAPMVAAYASAGRHFDADAFHWWKVLGTLRWGIGLSRQAVQFLDGTYRNIAMAGSGRRAVELEHDLLQLLRPPGQLRA